MTRILIVFAVLAVMAPSVLLASDEVSLEELAETVAGLVARVERLESIWAGPGATDLGGGVCLQAERQIMQDETVLKYKEKFDKWLDLTFAEIYQVRFDGETGNALIVYTDSPFASKFVIEEWAGCEFLGSTDWWQE